jgi:hypothetical protein
MCCAFLSLINKIVKQILYDNNPKGTQDSDDGDDGDDGEHAL